MLLWEPNDRSEIKKISTCHGGVRVFVGVIKEAVSKNLKTSGVEVNYYQNNI